MGKKALVKILTPGVLNSVNRAFHSLDFVLCDNRSALIVQQLQLVPAEVILVAIASDGSFMAGE